MKEKEGTKFRSIDEIRTKFFPEASEEEAIEEMPERYGVRLAARAIRILQSELNK